LQARGRRPKTRRRARGRPSPEDRRRQRGTEHPGATPPFRVGTSIAPAPRKESTIRHTSPTTGTAALWRPGCLSKLEEEKGRPGPRRAAAGQTAGTITAAERAPRQLAPAPRARSPNAGTMTRMGSTRAGEPPRGKIKATALGTRAEASSNDPCMSASRSARRGSSCAHRRPR
jgi:hypothetical protein